MDERNSQGQVILVQSLGKKLVEKLGTESRMSAVSSYDQCFTAKVREIPTQIFLHLHRSSLGAVLVTVVFRTLPMFPLQFNINAPMPFYGITPILWGFFVN